jgi:hypothetical protein
MQWTRGVAQVVDHGLCRGKDLSSNPNPTKKKKRMPASQLILERKKCIIKLFISIVLFKLYFEVIKII